MNIILLLIPLSIVFLALGVWAFFWAVNNAQFDDLDTPALSPLVDDELPLPADPDFAPEDATRPADDRGQAP